MAVGTTEQEVEPLWATIWFVVKTLLIMIVTSPFWGWYLVFIASIPSLLIAGMFGLPEGPVLLVVGTPIWTVVVVFWIKEFVVNEVKPRRRPKVEEPAPIAPAAEAAEGRQLPTHSTTVAPIGHRLWALIPTQGPSDNEPIPVLAGPITRQIWWQPEIEATCNRGFAHAIPDLDCTCGIYAMKEPLEEGREPVVEGRVRLSGTVVEGEYGYRATRARIVGPLEIIVPCAMTAHDGPIGFRTCKQPVRMVALMDNAFVGGCRDHPVTGIVTWTPGGFIRYVEQWLRARYGTEARGAGT